MKGIIRDNLGDSRYVVGVTVADQPLADELKKYQDLYDATIPRITDAYGALNDLRDGYNAALDAIAAVAADYELCRLAFSSTNCLATGRGACESAYLEADAACLEIESGIGECDPDCQRERARCQESAKSVRSACLAQVEIDCAEAEFKHIEECQKTWAPLIAKAQEAALKLLPGMQEALYNLQHEQALQWQLARKLNELEGIQAREYEITCFSAQYNEDLSGEVEMARTPNGRHVITGLVTAPTPCLHDARVLPSGHLFVNAALWPGFETWRPTWRVGTVKEVIAPKLKIEFAPANMAGGLGTLYTENPLDCTPPQIYFDGKSPLEAEADIKAARDALNAAQQDLLELVKVRTECIAEYDQAWFDQCYGAAVEICDAAFGEAMEQPTLDKGQCYEDAQTTCQEQTEAGLAACTESYQPAIDEAQQAKDAAQGVYDGLASDLLTAQQALALAEQDLATCLLESETPETCAEEFQPAIDAAQAAVDGIYIQVLNAQIVLGNAVTDLEDATQALAACQADWVLADCLAAAIQLCDDTFQMAEDTYTQQKAACYQEAMAECDRQRDEAIQACYDASAEAIEAAQTAVDAAARDVELATNGRYNPANPLILDCPVAQCAANNYQVGDEVLIDFPVRSGAAMDVWNSRRVIGWATDPRECEFLSIEYLFGLFDFEGEPSQQVARGGDGTPFTIVSPKSTGFYSSCTKGSNTASGSAPGDLVLAGWTDGKTENPRTEINVQDNLVVGAVGVAWPQEIYLPIYYGGEEMASVYAGAASLQFYSATGIPDFFGTLHWFTVPWPVDNLEAVDWEQGMSFRLMGLRDNLPGILPEQITVVTKDLVYSGLTEQSKIYERSADVIEGNQCATPYLMYRYTRAG
ncbi:MAG: hypothetical protein WAT23_15885 [Chromatiaceae bacterium]